ncbi:MAG: cytochrome c3 family protein [Planctomycetota bacterium]
MNQTAPPSGDPPRPTSSRTEKFVFPRWANYVLPLLVLGAIGGGMYAPTAVYLGLNPDNLNLNYRPEQPIPYSHATHVGQLGMDCTYCHNTVKHAAFAAVPPSQTCVACHGNEPGANFGVKTNSAKLAPLYESIATGDPIEWIKVHDIADYAYFNHAAHTTKGIGCVTCHGRVDQMGEEGVYQVHNLSMSWCIECHRQPEKYLRPASEVTNMVWSPLDEPEVQDAIAAGELEEGDQAAAQLYIGEKIKADMQINNKYYMQACSTCHR